MDYNSSSSLSTSEGEIAAYSVRVTLSFYRSLTVTSLLAGFHFANNEFGKISIYCFDKRKIDKMPFNNQKGLGFFTH